MVFHVAAVLKGHQNMFIYVLIQSYVVNMQLFYALDSPVHLYCFLYPNNFSRRLG